MLFGTLVTKKGSLYFEFINYLNFFFSLLTSHQVDYFLYKLKKLIKKVLKSCLGNYLYLLLFLF